MTSKLKATKNKFFFRYAAIAAIFMFCIIIALVLVTVKLSDSTMEINSRPNQLSLDTAISSEINPGQATIATSANNTLPMARPKELPDQAQISEKTSEYGIAAGGGLEFFKQDDLDSYFDTLKSLGAEWIRWDIDWNVIQPDNSGDYEWPGADRVASTAKRYGIKSLGVITYTPEWAISRACNLKWKCAPSDPQDFGRFAGQAAKHYKDTIFYWEIWNEPNYTLFWGPKPNVEIYSALLKASYIEIKKANPRATVLSGGLANTGDTKGGNISPLTFIGALYSSNAHKYFDAVALHPYTYPFSPDYPAAWNSWRQIESIRQLMAGHGDSAKKIWITEYGAPTGGPGLSHTANQLNNFKYGADFMEEDAQLNLLTEAANFYQDHKDWLGPFFWYTLKDSSDKRDTVENFFGLIRSDGIKKPAYGLFRTTISTNE